MKLEGIRVFFNNFMYRVPHFHKSLELMLVLSGEMSVNTERVSLRLAPDDIAIINAGVPHELTAINSDCTFLCIQFMPDSYWSAYPPIHFESNLPREHLGAEEYKNLKETMLHMADAYFSKTPFYELCCISAITSIIYTLLRSMPIISVDSSGNGSQRLIAARVMRLVDFVDRNYKSKIRLAEFARSEGKSLSYISRFISSALNQSFQSYVNTVRFYAACRLIAAGNMSMLDICYEVGFSDYRYFSNVFKERTGLTPAQYRREHEDMPMSYDVNNEHICTESESLALLERLKQSIDFGI